MEPALLRRAASWAPVHLLGQAASWEAVPSPSIDRSSGAGPARALPMLQGGAGASTFPESPRAQHDGRGLVIVLPAPRRVHQFGPGLATAPREHEEPHDRGARCLLRSSSAVLGPKMSIHRFIMLSAAALAASVSNTDAGPCSHEMTHRCRPACAGFAAGLSLPESVGAMMHRQPTRGSVAAAEERLASMARCRSARLRVRPHMGLKRR